MKLHRHHKNKPYKVHGVAKHSETLEDLVVYETLYDNPTAKLWVRPKVMFEENLVLEGKSVPRFAQVPLQIYAFDKVTDAEEKHLQVLIKETLGEWDPRWFHSNLRNHNKIYLQIGFVDSNPISFKLGYELDQWTFYSWLGGVLPLFRGLGVASDLMNAQHEWCRSQGYQKVQTKSQNRWRNQMILNLKQGFEITGYHSSDEGGPKIMLEKKL